MISAECHTADDGMTVEFDATPWLAGADADGIVLLSRRGWSGPEVAEALATRPGNEGLGELLRYARERLEKEIEGGPVLADLHLPGRRRGGGRLARAEPARGGPASS